MKKRRKGDRSHIVPDLHYVHAPTSLGQYPKAAPQYIVAHWLLDRRRALVQRKEKKIGSGLGVYAVSTLNPLLGKMWS
jgi:hypothetical protein